jgi:hypothetical protein
VGVALRQVEVPDVNTGPNALGPNEIVNTAIASGDYLRRYMTGVLHLTLVEPRADYVPGQKIGWDRRGCTPGGQGGGDRRVVQRGDPASRARTSSRCSSTGPTGRRTRAS